MSSLLRDEVMPVALEVAGMTKSFGPVKALRDVSVGFRAGAVTGLLGENGAGKSTLIRMCSGEMRPDRGSLRVLGKESSFANPLEAVEAGVVVVHQEPLLVSELTVADNLFLYDLGERPGYAPARRRDNLRKAEEVLARLDMADYLPPPSTLCRHLSAASRQMVDIVRALSRDPKVLFLDEPNSSLTHEESERLFTVVDRLRKDGVAVVLVSHRLAEVYDIVDHVVVLRDGQFIEEGPAAQIPQERAIALMAGERKREVVSEVMSEREFDFTEAPVALSVRNLSGDGFKDVSFDVHAGEIVGMSGLVGAGRTEIAEAVIGVRRVDSGEIVLNGERAVITGPGKAQRLGIAFVSEERRTEVFKVQSVGFNLTARIFETFGQLGAVSVRTMNKVAAELRGRFNVKSASIHSSIMSLSGGNQQKVLLARALAAKPKVLILDEPTRGVDVGTKAEIYATLRKLAAEEGLAVWFISSELEEVIELADRVVVVRLGEITRDAPNNSGPEPIIAAAMGATKGQS